MFQKNAISFKTLLLIEFSWGLLCDRGQCLDWFKGLSVVICLYILINLIDGAVICIGIRKTLTDVAVGTFEKGPTYQSRSLFIRKPIKRHKKDMVEVNLAVSWGIVQVKIKSETGFDNIVMCVKHYKVFNLNGHEITYLLNILDPKSVPGL